MAKVPHPSLTIYFLASLATCAGIYVLGFCQKRDIPYDGISLSQSWERDEKTKRLTNVRIAIEVPSDFPGEVPLGPRPRGRQCAVKKTLENPPEFVVETAVSS